MTDFNMEPMEVMEENLLYQNMKVINSRMDGRPANFTIVQDAIFLTSLEVKVTSLTVFHFIGTVHITHHSRSCYNETIYKTYFS